MDNINFVYSCVNWKVVGCGRCGEEMWVQNDSVPGYCWKCMKIADVTA